MTQIYTCVQESDQHTINSTFLSAQAPFTINTWILILLFYGQWNIFTVQWRYWALFNCSEFSYSHNSCLQEKHWVTKIQVSYDQLLSVAFALCLGVPVKKNQAKISLYPCNKKSEFQKWECRNATLAIQGEDLFLSPGKTKDDNIVLNIGSATVSKWKIYRTMGGLCSRDHEGKV